MPPRSSILLCWLLLGCSAPPGPPPAAPPAPTGAPASAAPSSSAAGPPSWESVDPRAVRCGVDDRPRNILGAGPGFGAALAPRPERRLLAEAPAAPAKIMMEDIAPPLPTLRVERLPLQLAGGEALPAGLAAALAAVDPEYGACDALMTDPQPPGAMAFTLELASSGAPLRVTPQAAGQPGAYAHCLMERTCQLQTRTAPGQVLAVSVPLRVFHEPPPGTPRPEETVKVTLDGAVRDELQLQLVAAASEVARLCEAIPGQVSAQLTIELQVRRVAPPPRRRRVTALTSFATVTQVRMKPLAGVVPPAVQGCVTDTLKQRSFAAGAGSNQRSERLTITWNP